MKNAVFRRGRSIDEHEVDESALHVRRHQLDADLLAHLESTGTGLDPPSAGGAKMRTHMPGSEQPVTNAK